MDLISSSQVAAQLGTTVRTVHTWRKSGRLPPHAYTTGAGYHYWAPTDIEEFKEDRAEPPPMSEARRRLLTKGAWSIEELAEIIGVSVSTARNMVRDGRLPPRSWNFGCKKWDPRKVLDWIYDESEGSHAKG